MDHRRYDEAPDVIRHQPPMAIDTALRSHCGIWAKQYFVAVIMDDGTPTTFFSPGPKFHDSVVCHFFDAKKFQQVAGQLDSDQIATESNGPDETDESMYFRPVFGNRHRTLDRLLLPSNSDGDEGAGYLPRLERKRPRARQTVEDEDLTVPILLHRGIRVSDARALWSFYDQRFKSCQQSACKLIAKAWVKALEPKKQSTHPYTGSDAKAPDWWPKPWGPTKENRVRHKEPDHLYKRERVHLLNHILAMIVEPIAKQHPNVRKLHLSLKKLEECTNEALSGFFGETPQNASKKLFLNEIFKVARQQDLFQNGEIDASTELYILNDERMVDNLSPENDEGPFGHHHDDQNESPSTRSNITHSFHQTPSSKHGPAIISQASSFMNKPPMRNSQQPPPQWSMINDLGAPQQPGFVEDSLPVNSANSVHTPSTSIGVDMMPSANGSSRRSSVLPKYSHVVGNGMYTQHGQPGSAAPNAQANYSNKQNGLTQSFVTTVPATPPQSYMGNSLVDTMTRPGYDPYHGYVYHAGDVTSGQVGQQSNYNSISSDGRGLQTPPDVSKVIDSVPRGHME